LAFLAAGLLPDRFDVTRFATGDVTFATAPGSPEPLDRLIDRVLAATPEQPRGAVLRRRVDATGVWRVEAEPPAGAPAGDLVEWRPSARPGISAAMRVCGVAQAGGAPVAALVEVRSPLGVLPMVARRARSLTPPPLPARWRFHARVWRAARIRPAAVDLVGEDGEVTTVPLLSLRQAAEAARDGAGEVPAVPRQDARRRTPETM
jgi:hypothetical protein